MNDFSIGFLVAILIIGIIVNLPISNVSKYNNAIEECEKSLPRDQHCKVIGVLDDSSK